MNLPCRTLVFVPGDGLDRNAASLRDFDAAQDVVVFVEAHAEVVRYGNHRMRVGVFLLAMRAFADELRAAGRRVWYQRYDDAGASDTLAGGLERAILQVRPQQVQWVQTGRHGLDDELAEACAACEVPHRVLEDESWLCSRAEFAEWCEGRSMYRMEHFYRVMRRRMNVLVEGDKPVGGKWNFDAENREAFGPEGPGWLPPIPEAPLSEDERALLNQLEALPGLNGTTADFVWPRTPAHARAQLDFFITHHLAAFGTWQDAIWAGEPFLHHSMLSVALNLHLMDPREVVAAAEQAWREGRAPLNAVEGFIRQVIGWREFIRGIYWQFMPDYMDRNALNAEEELPPLFWTGRTRMACMADTVQQLLKYAWAHHIQRLMVAGLFAQLYAARPIAVHEWFMAYYVDSVEWVTLPNVLGMSQFGDGGIVGSKPYVATGRYIDRQSNHCANCVYRPDESVGERACPFTTLYWEFLHRHRERFDGHPRLGQQVRNLARKSDDELAAILARAAEVRKLAASELL